MFSLIITVISIALVAALALATLYYGGSAFNKGAAKADAAKILLQGQQLIGASELFKAGENRWPANMAELQSSKYITSVPQAKAAVQSAVELANAAGTEWTMPKAKTPMFLLSNVASLDVCGYVNQQGSLKNKGVLVQAYPGLAIQCYGPAATLKVVIKKDTDSTSLDGPLQDIDPTEVGTALPPGVTECIANPLECRNQWNQHPPGWDPGVWTQLPGTTPSTPPGSPDGGAEPALPPYSVEYASSGAPDKLVFSFPGVGVQSSPEQVTVTNNGSSPLTFGNIGASTVSPFSLTENNCVSLILAPGESCSVSIAFTPSAATAYVDPQYVLTLETLEAAVAVLPLSGDVYHPSGLISLTYEGAPTGRVAYNGQDQSDWGTSSLGRLERDWAAGYLPVNADDPVLGPWSGGEGDNLLSVQTFKLTTTNLSAVALKRTWMTRFLLSGVSSTCTSLLLPGASCETVVKTTGNYYSRFRQYYETPAGAPVIASWDMYYSAFDAFNLTPEAFQFDAVVGESLAGTFELTNNKVVAVPITVQGVNGASATSDCGSILAANSFCTVNFSYVPTADDVGAGQGEPVVLHGLIDVNMGGWARSVVLNGTF